ncbi:MAG: helix-hairpin-helix domain-containing protein [Bacteroidetes bacterium]|nr:helix-hairpin-helix domain-containing protein [Bacteroidota bacterium]
MGAIGFKFKASRDDSELCFKGWKIQNERGSEKVYGFKNADYNRLQTYISLPDSGTYYSDKKAAKEKKKEALHVDLAKADSLEILKLPGIGPGFTHRIIAYRNKLGGFYSLEQLHEVWGFSDSLYTTLTGLVYLSDTVPFNPLRINTISKEELKSHPYVGYKLAGLLINYRDQHGAFKSLDDFRNLPLITEENLRKLAPYLKFRD